MLSFRKKLGTKTIGFILIIFISILTAGLTVISYLNGWIMLNNPSKKDFPVRGVDVSSYQGEIDWIALSKNIDFAYIKATEGKSFVDERFRTNWDNAQRTNLRIGAYHFFSFESSGKDQADNFIKNVSKVENILPPVIDIEFYSFKDVTIPSNSTVKKEMTDLISALENFYGKKPVLYVSYDTYNQFIKNNFLNNPIWIRDIFFTPKFLDNREWTFWQYTDKGRLEGYKGLEKFIDLDVFNGSREDFQKL